MTYTKRQGYDYYVYLGPGNISYFRTYEEAKEYADLNDAEVKENW
jgi:hypothetical protein